jgi:acylphosphatase
MSAFNATVRGRVQHVGFRYYACKEADKRHIRGWVRNCADGTVEVQAEGEGKDLKKFLEWLWQGPPHGHVDGVNTRSCEPSGCFNGFTVDYDE